MQNPEHGGGVDAAASRYGIARENWLDLSTGVNPQPYPFAPLSTHDWGTLPDQVAMQALLNAARCFWNVPPTAAILAAAGASQLIAQLPRLAKAGRVDISTPTYNEHARAFTLNGWVLGSDQPRALVRVHPNNPDGTLWPGASGAAPLVIIDESFCDICPSDSHIDFAARKGTIILKSFGKFWGLAGVRLGFAIGDPELIKRLRDMLGPWVVSGPALKIGTQALNDPHWAAQTRVRLAADANQLDQIMTQTGSATLIGGTTLFRLYQVANAITWQNHLAKSAIWSRIFPYSNHWLRLGLPADAVGFERLHRAAKTFAKDVL